MDPNANLAEQLRLAARLWKQANGGVLDHDDVARLCDLVVALDGWIAKGGALPDAWNREEG